MDIGDPSNITGLSDIIPCDTNIDLSKIEKNIIAGNGTSDDEYNDPSSADQYKKELEEMGRIMGIDLNEEKYTDPDLENDEDDDREESQEESRPDIDELYERVNENPAYIRGDSNTHDSYRRQITAEQKKQRILKHVLADLDDGKFSVEKEKEEDDKAVLLEQISSLLTNLEDDGIDVSRIPEVTSSSSFKEILDVHKILRLKNDRNRYCTFAEEMILAGSHTLELAFNGRRSYFGKKPDLTGWSATVNTKLRRMRYDTSTFVSDVMQEYNLSHGTRIVFELLPSLFLYGRMRKSQHKDNLISSDEMNDAMSRIRDIDESADEE